MPFDVSERRKFVIELMLSVAISVDTNGHTGDAARESLMVKPGVDDLEGKFNLAL